VISLGIGAPDITTPIGLKEALKQAVDNDYNNYDQSIGNLEIRKAIAEKYKEYYGVEYDPLEGVIVTTGGVELIYVALQTYLKPGEEVLHQDPCFLTYPRQVVLAGGKMVWMPSTPDFKIDIEKTKEKITDKSRIMILNFPSNPTGAVMTRQELKALVDIAEDHNLLILSDEVYEHIIFNGKKHVHIGSIDNAYERTITVNSFSKTYAIPGWRMGFGVTTPEILKPILKYHTYVVANSTTPTQVALANYMQTKESEEFIRYIRDEFQKRRDVIVKGFNSIEGISCQEPVGSFYCYPDISQTKYPNCEEFSEKAFKDARVVLVPGLEFGPGQTPYIRASFGSAGVEQIQEVIERLNKIL
jgi:aspartate/methionine/tyrosine aminotransferase